MKLMLRSAKFSASPELGFNDLPKPLPGLPTPKQILDFIASSPTPAGKREIARGFGLQGQEKIALKALLRDMADEGLIDGKKTAFHRMGGVPRVTVLRVTHIEEGEAIAVPDSWQPDDATPPPRLRMVEKGKHSALKVGDRVLARTEEAGAGWRAHAMKKLPAREEQLLGVVEFDGAGKPWLAPVDKRVRNSAPIADLAGAEAGQLVLAEPAGRGPRSGVRVTEVLGDPLAPRAFSLIAIHKHGIPNHFAEEALTEAELAAKLPLSAEKREDLRHLPIVAIDPVDARDHDDAIWAEPDGEGGFRALVAIADVSFYVRPGGEVDREARLRGNSVYFPDRVVPMLPEVLSADVCSLRSGEDRAAMACHLHIDAAGRVTEWRFTRALVRIAEVIAYEEAQARIDAYSSPSRLREGPGEGLSPNHAQLAHPQPLPQAGGEKVLQNLWACWAALNNARNDRDPLALDLPERRVKLDEAGRITEIALRESLDAHRVVEDFMIAANVAAAKALESKASPVVYRIHEPPGREKLVALKDYLATFDMQLALGQVITPGLFNRMLKDVADDAEKALIMEAVLRSQTQAYYGPRNMPGISDWHWAAMRTSPRRSGAMPTCWSTARWSMASISNSPRQRHRSSRHRACQTVTATTSARSVRRSAPPSAAPWPPSARPSTAMSPPGCRRGSARCSRRGLRACRNSASSPPSSGWAATGWCRSRLWVPSVFPTMKRRRYSPASKAAPAMPSATNCACASPKPIR